MLLLLLLVVPLLLCSYEFGMVDAAGVRKSLYTGTSIAEFSSSLMLPEGNNTLYVCVSDTDGAQACETTVVTVKKDENFQLSDAISKFDVGHLTSTNDVGVLAAGAAALQSMNAYAQQQTAGDGAAGGNDTSSSAADEAQKKKLQEEIDTKAGALINSLAGNADALVSDPQSMQQVRGGGEGGWYVLGGGRCSSLGRFVVNGSMIVITCCCHQLQHTCSLLCSQHRSLLLVFCLPTLPAPAAMTAAAVRRSSLLQLP
jgi:hypothetical protein